MMFILGTGAELLIGAIVASSAASIGTGIASALSGGPDIPAPKTTDPQEPNTDLAKLAEQRKSLEAKRQGRSSFVIQPATGLSLGTGQQQGGNTTGTGLNVSQ